MKLKTSIVALIFMILCYGSNIRISPKNSYILDTLEVHTSSFPKDYQLYARDMNNKAQITIVGSAGNFIDSLITKVYKPNNIVTRTAIKAQSSFSISVEIEALLYNYTIELFAKKDGTENLVKHAKHITAGDVYVIHGQSNAWAIDYDNKYNSHDLSSNSQWVRTIGAMHVYNSAAIEPEVENTDWFLASGKTPDIYNGGAKVGLGMVGVLGMRLGLNLVESENVPIAIVNGAGGGGAISYYQKSFNKDLDVPYGRLQNRLEASGLKDKIKAFIWNQGENNDGDSTKDYKYALIQLYNSFRSDYMFEKFYVIQTPPGCNSAIGHQTIREAQRQFVEETENTRVLTRHGFSPNPVQSNGNYFLSDGCHYHAHGYEVLASWIANLAAFDFSGKTVNYEAPKIKSVQFESSSSLIMAFDKEVAIQSDIQINGIWYTAKDYLFAINDERTISISTLELFSENRKIRITFLDQTISVGDTLTHILGDNYPNTSIPYQGPWIIDAITGVGAVGFTKNIEL